MPHPNDTVRIDVEVLVTEEGDNWTRTHTEERTYRFLIESYEDLKVATRQDMVDVFGHFLDTKTYSHGSGRGWAVDADENATIIEDADAKITVTVNTSTVYDLAVGDGIENAREVYKRLRAISTGARSPGEPTSALLHFIHNNTDGLDRDKIEEEWDVPTNWLELKDW